MSHVHANVPMILAQDNAPRHTSSATQQICFCLSLHEALISIHVSASVRDLVETITPSLRKRLKFGLNGLLKDLISLTVTFIACRAVARQLQWVMGVTYKIRFHYFSMNANLLKMTCRIVVSETFVFGVLLFEKQ